jgi:RNA polymerase sigma-70 factor (ECF subfamily)
MLGQRDEAADATQDAFFSAFRAIRSFHGMSFRAWLLRIVVNCCYDNLRRRKRQQSESLEALTRHPDRPLAVRDPGPGPDKAAATAETAEMIERCLDTLAPDHRAIVVLCDVNGLSYEEAGETLGIGIGTVKSRLSRARAHLRDELVARGELPEGSQRQANEGLART